VCGLRGEGCACVGVGVVFRRVPGSTARRKPVMTRGAGGVLFR